VAEAGFAILPVEVFDTLPLPAQPLGEARGQPIARRTSQKGLAPR
jgi:hypothetical protein